MCIMHSVPVYITQSSSHMIELHEMGIGFN